MNRFFRSSVTEYYSYLWYYFFVFSPVLAACYHNWNEEDYLAPDFTMWYVTYLLNKKTCERHTQNKILCPKKWSWSRKKREQERCQNPPTSSSTSNWQGIALLPYCLSVSLFQCQCIRTISRWYFYLLEVLLIWLVSD